MRRMMGLVCRRRRHRCSLRVSLGQCSSVAPPWRPPPHASRRRAADVPLVY
ncbi:hypothetical protein ACP4OV_008901 [Aristida adscensionis]